jgi:hypothetical protein
VFTVRWTVNAFKQLNVVFKDSMLWFRQLVSGLSPPRPGFDVG